MNNLQVFNASRALPRGCASRATPTHVGPLMIWHMRAYKVAVPVRLRTPHPNHRSLRPQCAGGGASLLAGYMGSHRANRAIRGLLL